MVVEVMRLSGRHPRRKGFRQKDWRQKNEERNLSIAELSVAMQAMDLSLIRIRPQNSSGRFWIPRTGELRRRAADYNDRFSSSSEITALMVSSALPSNRLFT